MLVSVAFSSSTMNFSPLSGVTKFMVNRIPSALRLSIRMPRKLRNSSVDIARITSGLPVGGLALRNSRPEFVSGGEEAVAQARVLLLIADLLEDVRQQVFCGIVIRLGLDQLVHDLRGEEVPPLVMQFAATGEDLLGPAHQLDIERRGVGRR